MRKGAEPSSPPTVSDCYLRKGPICRAWPNHGRSKPTGISSSTAKAVPVKPTATREGVGVGGFPQAFAEGHTAPGGDLCHLCHGETSWRQAELSLQDCLSTMDFRWGSEGLRSAMHRWRGGSHAEASSHNFAHFLCKTSATSIPVPN